ncbi:hypothetical protein [Actinocrispum wychmicini]|uniref:Uncharacterized protein n=1 Tax=Actinocrispum wychmicini TaxID=1213861 RepID=A0A4V2S3R2_9PSEU|nr:hypothetical protein [Actinocrispum wychmicini]TCO45300.1 hypothetical protein EV192_12164 [Actinocrispum wychmicini]
MSRLRKLTVSLVLGATIIASTATPAMAAPQTDRTAGARPAATQTIAVDPMTIAEAAKAAYDLYKMFAGGGLTLEDATHRILAAIQQARDAIIHHIDAVAAANVQACARSAVVDFPNFQILTPDNKQTFALNATSCVILGDTLLNTLVDKGAIDQLGFALNAVGPIALITRSWVHFTNAGIPPILTHSNQVVYNQIKPVCGSFREPGNPTSPVWACTAYNGDYSDMPLRLPHDTVIDEAAYRTSWLVAKAVLPVLPLLS